MKMNKKGILMPYVLIFTILSISVSIGLMFWIEGSKTEFNIGETQEKIISTYVDSMSDKYFFKNTLKNNGEDSISKILKNTGIKNPIFKDSYILWKKGNKECFPNDWDNLKEILVSELEYDVSRGENSLIVTAGIPLNVSFEGDSYDLESKKNFNKEYIIEGFNFDDFIGKVDKIKEVVDDCNNDESCWNSNLDGFSYEKEGNLFKVSFTTQDLEGNLQVKVGVDFEEELNIGEEELRC